MIENIVNEREKKIKEQYDNEKSELKAVLTRIIRDALKFFKECTPMISMMPYKLKTQIEAIKRIGDEKKSSNLNLNNNTSNTLNLSNGSNLNKSMLTN